jgi:hypothetical protein
MSRIVSNAKKMAVDKSHPLAWYMCGASRFLIIDNLFPRPSKMQHQTSMILPNGHPIPFGWGPVNRFMKLEFLPILSRTASTEGQMCFSCTPATQPNWQRNIRASWALILIERLGSFRFYAASHDQNIRMCGHAVLLFLYVRARLAFELIFLQDLIYSIKVKSPTQRTYVLIITFYPTYLQIVGLSFASSFHCHLAGAHLL